MKTASRERGAIAITAAILTVVLVVLGMGGATLGRIVAAKADARRAADAASLAAAELGRDKGRTGIQPATQVGNFNLPGRSPSWAGMGIQENSFGNPGSFAVSADPSFTIFTSQFFVGQDAFSVRSHAKAYVNEMVFRGFQNQNLKIMLVLDFSGSMSGERMAMLKKAVREEAIGSDLQIEWAAVLYDDQIMGRAEFKPVNAETKKDILDLLDKNDARGGTSTGMAMKEAEGILDKATGGGNGGGNHDDDRRPNDPNDDNNGVGKPPVNWMLVISDGPPGDEQLARDTALQAAKEKGYGVMTLDVSGTEMGFMKEIAGTPVKYPDDSYAVTAKDPAQLREVLRDLIAGAICPARGLPGADNGARPACPANSRVDCQRIGGFLRPPGGGEQVLPAGAAKYMYTPATLNQPPTVRLNYDACLNRAVRNHEEFVVRYNRAKLAE